jgi:hypothetical protein
MSGGGGDGMVGVAVGVDVEVNVGVTVGVTVGVAVGDNPLKDATTSPAEPPTAFHIARVRLWDPELACTEIPVGVPTALTVVGADHTAYGALASVYLTAPPSINQETNAEFVP